MGADLTYFLNEPIGAGLKFGLFKSSNSLSNIYRDNADGSRSYGSMSDDVSVFFIGPAFTTRIMAHDKRNAFLMNMALGYIGYSNDKVIIDKYKMTGNTIGLVFDLGYDFGLSENLSLGVQVSMITGTLTKYDWTDGFTTESVELDNDEYESLSRIDLSVGLRFGK